MDTNLKIRVEKRIEKEFDDDYSHSLSSDEGKITNVQTTSTGML